MGESCVFSSFLSVFSLGNHNLSGNGQVQVLNYVFVFYSLLTLTQMLILHE